VDILWVPLLANVILYFVIVQNCMQSIHENIGGLEHFNSLTVVDWGSTAIDKTSILPLIIARGGWRLGVLLFSLALRMDIYGYEVER